MQEGCDCSEAREEERQRQIYPPRWSKSASFSDSVVSNATRSCLVIWHSENYSRDQNKPLPSSSLTPPAPPGISRSASWVGRTHLREGSGCVGGGGLRILTGERRAPLKRWRECLNWEMRIGKGVLRRRIWIVVRDSSMAARSWISNLSFLSHFSCKNVSPSATQFVHSSTQYEMFPLFSAKNISIKYAIASIRLNALTFSLSNDVCNSRSCADFVDTWSYHGNKQTNTHICRIKPFILSIAMSFSIRAVIKAVLSSPFSPEDSFSFPFAISNEILWVTFTFTKSSISYSPAYTSNWKCSRILPSPRSQTAKSLPHSHIPLCSWSRKPKDGPSPHGRPFLRSIFPRVSLSASCKWTPPPPSLVLDRWKERKEKREKAIDQSFPEKIRSWI